MPNHFINKMRLLALVLFMISHPLFSQHGPPAELEIEGTVRLYKETIITNFTAGANGFSSRKINYYAERNHIYKIVFTTGSGDHIAELDTLKTFFSDDPEILKKIADPEFRYNQKSLASIVKEYNLKHFKGVGNRPYTTKSPVSFYSVVKPKIKEKLKLKVNDSIEYVLHPKFPTPIQLAIGAPSKVCVMTDGGAWCEIMAPDPEGPMYFELIYSTVDKSFEIERRTLNQYKNYLSTHVTK